MKKRRRLVEPYVFDFAKRVENPWGTARNGHKRPRRKGGLATLEVCAGGGGEAIGFEQAGIDHAALVEIDKSACATLRLNRPEWKVIQEDLAKFHGSAFAGVDILSGGVPCPPFSVAGKQLGHEDERNLFPAVIRLTDEIRPRAVMIENVRGILNPIFDEYRRHIGEDMRKLGYKVGWKLFNACDFGVPQLRPRVIFLAISKRYADEFRWPEGSEVPPTVGDVLYELMSANGWRNAKAWAKRANDVAPTVVGGSLKHGGPDLGPTRARRAWAALGVDGLGIADEPPAKDFRGMPRLTVQMVARLQGFPEDWMFAGSKTQAYRQVGNAFPPPVARAVAEKLRACLSASGKSVQVAG